MPGGAGALPRAGVFPGRDEMRARVVACDDLGRLRALAVDLAGAVDAEAVEVVLGGLAAAPAAG